MRIHFECMYNDGSTTEYARFMHNAEAAKNEAKRLLKQGFAMVRYTCEDTVYSNRGAFDSNPILNKLLGAKDADYADFDIRRHLLQSALCILWDIQEDAEDFYCKPYNGDPNDLVSLYRFMHQYLYVAKLQIVWLYRYIMRQSVLDDAETLPIGVFMARHHYEARRLAAIACDERGLKSTYNLYKDIKELKKYENNL